MRLVFYSNPVLQYIFSLSKHHINKVFNKHALCFVTQIAIEMLNSPESRTDSCRTPAIHPFILSANS